MKKIELNKNTVSLVSKVCQKDTATISQSAETVDDHSKVLCTLS